MNVSLRNTAIATISFLVAAAVAILLGLAAAGDGVLAGDRAVTRGVQRLDGELIGRLMDAGNASGSTVGGLVVVSVVILIAAIWRAWRDVFFLIAILLLRLAATQIKPLFESTRPTADLATIHGTFDGSGYPSGHATTGMVIALGLSILAWRWARHRRVAMATTILLLALALLIGVARIWSGAHWASDVVGGYAVGVAIVSLAVLLRDRQAWLER